MNYTVEIVIEQSVDKVVELFDNPENMKKWMKGLVSFEHVSGEAGMPGAVSKLKFQQGKRLIEMTETITSRNLPNEFSGTYEASGVVNHGKHRFLAISDLQTKYVSEQEFIFNTFAMKVMGFLMPGAFKKQTLKYMQDFKSFAESEV